MADGTTYVGLDVHVETIAVAVLRPGKEVEDLGTIPNQPEALLKRLRKLGPAATLSVCYEAGPCGYGIYRQLTERGIGCSVVAPSLIPKKPGDRVKTDRRDAGKLARLLRSGDLTPVTVPTPEHEAVRALSRAREAAVRDLHRVRQRFLKFLNQQRIVDPAGTHWTKQWWTWACGVQLPQRAANLVLIEQRAAIVSQQERLDRLASALTEVAAASSLAPQIADLQHLHGVGPITATGVVCEVGDLTRFARPAQLAAYAGLVPSEYSSGSRRVRGGITKTGNAHLRYLLVEAAWHSITPLTAETTPPRSVAEQIARDARIRLHHRYYRFIARGKTKQTAIVAVARELLLAMWAIAQATQPPAPTEPAAI